MSGHEGGHYTATEVNNIDPLNPLLPASWNSERFSKVLQGKIDILSTNGLDAAFAPAPTTPGSIKAFCPETDPIVQYVSQQMEQYVKQMKELAEEMQNALQHISDELATEVGREQQHLMLMQDQVDKHKSDASREIHEMQRRLEQEKTQRTCMMRATREALNGFESKAEAQDARIEALATRVQALEAQLAERDAPLLLRIVRSFWRFLFGHGRRSCPDSLPDSAPPPSDREPLIDEAAFKTPQRTPVRPKQSQAEPAP